jgi:hypothetical protein
MSNINENMMPGALGQRDFARGLPFYGTKGDFNFTTGRSQFTPGVSIKQTPLTDMSVKGDPGISPIDVKMGTLRTFFKPGDRVRGIVVNSQASGKPKTVIGKLHKLLPNYANNTVRVWVTDPKTLKVTEVYVDTIERMYENLALTFEQFINS